MSKKPEPFNNAFSKLKLDAKPEKKPEVRTAPPPSRKAPAVDDDARLFLESIGEVAPVRAGKSVVAPPTPPKAETLRLQSEENEALTRLAELVSGTGDFDLADSDEFIEGHVQGFDERVLRKLRTGSFSVQAHLDLHGLTREEAKPALEAFVQKSKLQGHRCVLVVTGRGLHSKDQIPVLKDSVQLWISRGKIARHVLAFCTARQHDGGAGAIYLLLRR